MIQGFGSKRTEKIAGGRTPKGFPADLLRRTRALLTALNAAVELEDLRFPPGNHLEKLSGDAKVNIRFGSTGNGVSALFGPIVDRMKSRLWTTIEDR